MVRVNGRYDGSAIAKGTIPKSSDLRLPHKALWTEMSSAVKSAQTLK
jgi:hypothetical protein